MQGKMLSLKQVLNLQQNYLADNSELSIDETLSYFSNVSYNLQLSKRIVSKFEEYSPKNKQPGVLLDPKLKPTLNQLELA